MKIINEDDEERSYADVPISQGQSSMNCRTYQALFEKSVSKHGQVKTQPMNSVERMRPKNPGKPPRACVDTETKAERPVVAFEAARPKASRNILQRQSKSEMPAEPKPMEYLNAIVVEK